MGFPVKKTTLYAEKNEKKRQEFISEIKNIDPERLVFLDESGIDHSFHREYARSLVGSRVYGEISGNRASRTTLIAGYVKGGFIAPFRFKGYTDTNVFNQWVEKCLLPDLRAGQVVILDNATFHKSKRTMALIEEAGCRVLFLPPYSPDLNKIEPMWANIKRRLKSYYDQSLSFHENLDNQFINMCKC